jgi:hypothetical protein
MLLLLFCCCSGPAIVNFPSSPSVTADVGVHSDVGVPAVTGVIFFSFHAVVWHSAVDAGGKFATRINNTHGQ